MKCVMNWFCEFERNFGPNSQCELAILLAMTELNLVQLAMCVHCTLWKMGSKTISNCLQIYGVVMLESSNFLEAISSMMAKVEMGTNIHLYMWFFLTFDMDFFNHLNFLCLNIFNIKWHFFLKFSNWYFLPFQLFP